MLTDYHMHTPLCQHASGEPRDYVQVGLQRGLSEMGFSDHNPMPTQFDQQRMAPHQLTTYLKMIEDVRTEFPTFPIRLGLECDFIPGFEEHLRWLTQQTPWDYLIGSVHYLAPFSDPTNPIKIKDYEHQSPEEVWKLYFEAYTQAAQSGFFDFLAHPDFVKRYIPKPTGDLRPLYAQALDAIADNHLALEINTSGLRKKGQEMYPEQAFLEEAYKRGIPILINSDAHAPEDVGRDFDHALALVTQVGYRHLQRFIGRERRAVPIA